MTVSTSDISFTVKAVGDTSGRDFYGVFKSRPTLNFMLQMERDRLRREFLGTAAPESAPDRIKNLAGIFSELSVRITDAPTWWKESASGQMLEDDNVLAAVYDAQVEVQKKFYEDLTAKHNAAKKDLESLAPSTQG